MVAGLLVASFVLTDAMIDALHDLTGGRWGADVAVGVVIFLLPFAAVCVVSLLTVRRHWPRSWQWWVLVLYLPVLALEPFGRSGTNTTLQDRINRQLPGYLGGVLTGVGIFVVGLGLLWAWARRRGRGSPASRRLPP